MFYIKEILTITIIGVDVWKMILNALDAGVLGDVVVCKNVS
jgi:hypothetical protein